MSLDPVPLFSDVTVCECGNKDLEKRPGNASYTKLISGMVQNGRSLSTEQIVAKYAEIVTSLIIYWRKAKSGIHLRL